MSKLSKYIPIALQNIGISVYGKKLFKERYGSIYHTTIAALKQQNYQDKSQNERRQNIALQQFIQIVSQKSQGYQKMWQGIDVSQIKTPDHLNLLPITEKETFRQNIETVYTLPEEKSITSFTGGTTGKSLKVRYTSEDFQKRMAFLDHFKMQLGIDVFNDRKATFSGRSFPTSIWPWDTHVFWRHNKPYRQRLYSTFNINEENLPYYLKDLNAFAPEVINGFVSAIYDVALYIKRKQFKLDFTPKAIFTTSETLLEHHRETIEQVFNAPVYNQYASAEGAPFITECMHRKLHFNTDTGVIEMRQTAAGSEMVVTSFHTTGTPLVRYAIGDLIEFSEETTCKCGSALPIVHKIEGRNVDYLESAETGKVSLSHLADVIKGIPNSVINIQFVQHSTSHFEVLLIVDQSIFIAKHETIILKEMRTRFGTDVHIALRKVKHIERTSGGKYQLIKKLG